MEYASSWKNYNKGGTGKYLHTQILLTALVSGFRVLVLVVTKHISSSRNWNEVCPKHPPKFFQGIKDIILIMLSRTFFFWVSDTQSSHRHIPSEIIPALNAETEDMHAGTIPTTEHPVTF